MLFRKSILAYAIVAAKIIGKETQELEKLHEYFKKKSLIEDNDDYTSPSEIREKEFKKITEGLKV